VSYYSISRPAEGRRLSWPEHTVPGRLAACSRLLADGLGEIRTRSMKVTESPNATNFVVVVVLLIVVIRFSTP